MNVNEELISKELNSAYYQIEALKNNLQKIKDISYESIQKNGPSTNWVIINKLAHECQKILDHKIKTP